MFRLIVANIVRNCCWTIWLLEPIAKTSASSVEPDQPVNPGRLTRLYFACCSTQHFVSCCSWIGYGIIQMQRWISSFKQFNIVSINLQSMIWNAFTVSWCCIVLYAVHVHGYEIHISFDVVYFAWYAVHFVWHIVVI